MKICISCGEYCEKLCPDCGKCPDCCMRRKDVKLFCYNCDTEYWEFADKWWKDPDYICPHCEAKSTMINQLG